jgi:fibronectin type 3 domain-containing protein
MRWWRWSLLLLTLILPLSFFISCASSPEVEDEAILSGGNDSREIQGRIFVSPMARQRVYMKVAVMPFRAPVELVGASISDLFATELLSTHKYGLVERSQMEQVLGEQALGLKGVTENMTAMKVGKMLNVQGVIVGTVPEYGSKASGPAELAAIGINVRMIDVADGSIVWSISDSAISDRPISLSSFANRMVRNLVARLFREMILAGDTQGVNVPVPVILNSYGKIRSTTIEIQPDPRRTISSYKVFKSRTEKGPYQEAATLPNSESKMIQFEDRNLLDAETYYYQVRGVSRSRLTSLPTDPIAVTTSGPPGSVPGVTAQSGLIRKVVVSWQPLPDTKIQGYYVLRKTDKTGWEKVKTLEDRRQSTYTDQDLKDQTAYSYRIIAYNTVGTESPPSIVATATTKGAPSPVKKVEAVSLQARKIPLKWNPVNEPEIKGYVIFRADKEGGPFEKIAFVEGKETQYLDGTKKGFWGEAGVLKDETRYYYKIQAVNVVDVPSPDSPVVSAVTKGVPKPVTGLQAQQLEIKQVTLKWTPNGEEDIVKYEVFRGMEPSKVESRLETVPPGTSQFLDKGLKDGTKYYYRLRCVDKDGLEGKFSETVAADTKPVPGKPQGLKAVFEGNRIRVTWQPNGEKDIAQYVVQQKGFLAWDRAGEAAGNEYLFTGEVKKGKTYSFRVTAVDQTKLESEPSEEISVTIP